MAKDYSKAFYNSPAWKQTRKAYTASKRGLCEICLSRGIIRPAELVHHIVELTPENINDPRYSLLWDNLQCVCRECHAELHGARQRRYTIDANGKIIVRNCAQ